MATVLVVEGNTPEIVARMRAEGRVPSAENYAAVLTRLAPGLATRIVRPSFPAFRLSDMTLGDAAGVVFTGSGVHWSADAPEAADHRAVMEHVLAAGLPVIGSCYGVQLGAVVLGGRVRWSPNGTELPIARAIRLTDAGRTHALHAGRAAVFDCPCIHRDEVFDLPPGAILTATNDHSAVQAMAVERGGVRFWGMQYHPEMTLADVARSMARGKGAVMDATPGGKTPDPAIPDWIAVSEAPEAHPGLAARRAVAPEVLAFHARTVELANWLRVVVGAAVAEGLAAE